MTGEPRTLEEVLADPATWLPTRALADEAAAQLRRGCHAMWRDHAAAATRHLVEAVERGLATDTLLTELATQEAAVKALNRRTAEPGPADRRPARP